MRNHAPIPTALLAMVLMMVSPFAAEACTLVYPMVRVGPSFHAKVMDRGRPVRGLRLKLSGYAAGTTEGNNSIDTITDADGLAQFDEVPSGSFVLSADHDGGIADAVNVQVARDGPSDATVPLKWPSETPLRVRTVSGTLRDPVRPLRFSVSLLEGLSARVIQTSDTDNEGQFALPNVAAGIYFLKLSPFGVQTESPGQAGDLIAIEVSNEAEATKLDLDLGWSTCGMSYTERTKCSHAELNVETLCGEVADPVGAVISNADVLLMDDSPTPKVVRRTRTDLSGRFALQDAKDGTYQLLVRSPGFYPLQDLAHIQRLQAPDRCSRPVTVRLGLFGSCSSAELVPRSVSDQPSVK